MTTDFLNRLTAPITKRDREKIKLKYYDVTPHPNLQNFNTIKWLRSRSNHDVFQRSIYTMLPNNGIPVPDDKLPTRLDKAKLYLNTHCQPQDKFNKIHITPKYLYSHLIMTKIKKLRDIFLEFDEDGSRKLEIGEMVVMFNTNKIPVEEDELVGLFFKDKKLKKDEEPYLNFYQFMLFALSKDSDQDFRSFMRKLKKKNPDEIKKNEEEDENLFLPMNFNLVLDYFNNKGKQRDSQNKIQKAIDIMDEIISSCRVVQTENSDKNSVDINKNEDELEVHNKVNSEMLFEEFRNLFGQNRNIETSNNSKRMAKKLLGMTVTESEDESENKSKVVTRKNSINGKVLPTHISTMQTKTHNSENENQSVNNNINMKYTNFIKDKLYKQNASKTSIEMYEKYGSLLLATQETHKQMEKKKRENTATSHYSHFRSTANATGFNNAKKLNMNKTQTNEYIPTMSNMTKTGNTFYHNNNNLKIRENPSAKSMRSQTSKASIPHLPELLINNKIKQENNDYIPLKLLKELNPKIGKNK